MEKSIVYKILLIVYHLHTGLSIYVDNGNPYKDNPLKVAELTISKTSQGSPLHTKAYFPQDAGTYPAILFLGGFNTIVLAEYYETFLYRIASHGFFVFGIDYEFPVDKISTENRGAKVGQDISKYFKQYEWLQGFIAGKTVAVPFWNMTGLACHSAGCDSTLKLIKQYADNFTSTVFLEPFSYDVKEKVNLGKPAFMYGTEFSEGVPLKCAIPGYDYNTFYDIWSCPKVVMNVANFGHCDILDTVPWTVCKISHFCKVTANETLLPVYREFVQGAVSSFFISTLQGRANAVDFIIQKPLIPLALKELKSDWNCTKTMS